MKLLYFYSLEGEQSEAIRTELIGSDLVFNELRLESNLRKHQTDFPGHPTVVIDVDGAVYKEFSIPYDHEAMRTAWDSTPESLPPSTESKAMQLLAKDEWPGVPQDLVDALKVLLGDHK
jgi:hypothetical protein